MFINREKDREVVVTSKEELKIAIKKESYIEEDDKLDEK